MPGNGDGCGVGEGEGAGVGSGDGDGLGVGVGVGVWVGVVVGVGVGAGVGVGLSVGVGVGVGDGLGFAVGDGLGVSVGVGVGLGVKTDSVGVGDGPGEGDDDEVGCLGPAPKDSQLTPEWRGSQLMLPAKGSQAGPGPISQTRPPRPLPRKSVAAAPASNSAPAADATRFRRTPQKDACGAYAGSSSVSCFNFLPHRA